MSDVLTVDEAVKHLTEAAFEVTDEESRDFGRTIVHCFSRGMGADWDLHSAIAEVENAREIRWVDHLLGHNLLVVSKDGRNRCFDVKRPAGEVL